MNKDELAGKWHQVKGQAKAKWADLTDDDIGQAKGNAEALAGKLQERYGKTKEAAKKEVDDFLKNF